MNPSFFNRRKRDAEQEKLKKKWQIDEDSDEEDSLDPSETLTCCTCRGEPDLRCNDCCSYFCSQHFVESHPLDVDDGGREVESVKSKHRFRVLVGVLESKFDDMPVGWRVDDELSRVVIVANISFEVGEEEVRTFLARAGNITDFQFIKHGDAAKKPNMLHNGSARVQFESVKGAACALGLHGLDLHGRPLRVLTVGQSMNGGGGSSSRSVPYKVKMCQHLLNGQCRKGTSCSFAHHPQELPGGGKVHVPPSAPGQKHGVDGGFRW
ncbi:hypothetical protein GUITHDRAFT_141672 [Guillardia theta CCMP2712]|uniref:C3H1-type domain-containing protein n=1 Tax=Guillardia theta (strain CCMP2712) TaxID=905079 RepID=L1J1H4_GUITC|nr:hypothetical protein GUITHDRAFT_141672 [Guillardia theta CCMP2712]EKX41935.1 hypothetical protein GUITHDRAFT_141672 [Guillardia theta CCMP2712]|eukprot:XP_005828915.1 hypothetical protein GUITHDRAFT_141672 [Guillardia theta CCMP2712]